MKRHFSPTLIAIGVSAVMAIANSVSFFISVFSTPPQTVYLGTIHYWEDYFFYLNHFFQGAHGAWLTVNRYTPEATRPTIIYWSNVLAGKFFGILGLQPVVSYNVTVLILSFAVLFTAYLLIRKMLKKTPQLILPAFLMAALATSMQNRVRSSEGPMIFWPFQIWKTPHFAFDRLGGAPHQILITLITYLVFLAYYRRKTSPWTVAATAILAVMLALIQPVQALAVAGAITGAEVTGWLMEKRTSGLPFTKAFVLIAASGAASVYMYGLLNLPPHIQTKIWEATQHSYTTWPFLFLSIGPVAVLGIIGFAARLRRLESPEIAGAILIIVGYLMFMTKIPQAIGISNTRLLFPAFYAFWGVFGAYGAGSVAGVLKRRLNVPEGTGIAIVTGLFVIVSLPTLVWEIGMKLPKPRDLHDPLIYLPDDVYAGFSALEKTGSFDDTVVASPTRHMDSLVPALSGHTSYSGHMLATIDNAGKQGVAGRFFRRELDPPTAKTWLDKERIRYAFFTVYDGDQATLEKQYPFLVKVFGNSATAIYAVK